MSTATRMQLKAMIDSWGAFDTSVKLAETALSANKIKKYQNFTQLVHENYFKFDREYRTYKNDMIEKNAKTEDIFNGTSIDEQTGEEIVNYKYNDSWAALQMTRYSDTMEKLEDGLEASQSQINVDNKSVSRGSVDLILAVADAEFTAIETKVKKLQNDISNFADGSLTLVSKSVYDAQIENMTHRLTVGLMEKVDAFMSSDTDETESKQTLLKRFQRFLVEQQEILDNCSSMLCVKVKTDDPSLESKFSMSGVSAHLPIVPQPREQVFLEKSKPPQFNGEDIDFPEFKRKWTAIVTKAKLPIETELDKLRDNIPKDAKEQLFGVTSLEEAWTILTQRYGDPLLIGRKLKAQLKNVQPTGENDPERVISLKIKVRNVTTRLESLNMGEALQHDPEFLSSVYNALPERHKKGWWDFTKEKDKSLWDSMLSFLDKIYEQSNGELAMLPIFSQVDPAKPIKSAGLSAKQTDHSYDDSAKQAAKEACGLCPLCSNPHVYKKRDGSSWPTDRFFKCQRFQDMNVQQRALAVQDSNGCPRCTSWQHQKMDCHMKPNPCNETVNGSKCSGDHSKLLHGSGNAYCGVAKSSSVQSQSQNSAISSSNSIDDPFSIVNESEVAVYFLQDIPLNNKSAFTRTLWDKGSNRVLVREQFAVENQLISRDVTYRMEVVAGEAAQIVHSKLYLLDLKDMYGNVHTVWGYGVPRIMSSDVPDLSAIRHLFPHIPEAVFYPLVAKEVDLLIGLNMMELQPSGGLGIDRVGGLSALRSIFGHGWVLGGHHPKLRSVGDLSSAAMSLKIAKLLIRPEPSHTPEFWESEGMGVLPPRRCDTCKSCMENGACSERQYEHSLKKQAELDLIKSKTSLVNGEIWCDYPFVKDPACLPFNRPTVIKVAEKVERDLIKDGLHSHYCDQIKDFLHRGVAVKLSKEEMDSWSGAAQYITHHGVLKDSVTTPLRVVTNSSFNNGGNSLNSCLASGPNSLNPMLDVMLRFRSYPIAIHFDLSKAYNTLRTGLTERHLRRFVWRFSPNEQWMDFALDRVHFGDQCAATQLEVGKDIVADAGAHIDREASEKIKNDLYVDDGLTGGDHDQVVRMVGEKLPDGTFSGTLSRILSLGNYKIKALTVSGSKKSLDSDLMGDRVLGYSYNVETDMLGLKFDMNISKKKRSVRLDPNLTLDDLEKLRSTEFTKRILLGVTNGFGDFLGIGTPHTIKFKALMRELFLLDDPLSWDDHVPVDVKNQWIALMEETLAAGDLLFHRSTRPENALPSEGPVVVGFGDYGKMAYEARVYLRWRLPSSYGSRLAICKAKVPPLRGLTVPRGELTALTLLSRIVLVVVRALQKIETPPVSAIMMVDSKSSICAVDSTKNLLPYFQNRVAEIRENIAETSKFCTVEDVHYIASELNPSDLSTRATAKINELGPYSYHQTGPAFLCLPRSEWPVTRDYSASDLPSEEFKVRDKLVFSAAMRSNFCNTGTVVSSNNPWKAVEELLYYSNDVKKIIRILARYIRGLSLGNKHSVEMKIDNLAAYNLLAPEPIKAELEKAERLLLLHGMVQTQEALDAGKLTSLLPCREGKLVVTRGRLGEVSLQNLLGVSALPILMPNSRVAFLYMFHAHCGEFGLVHRSVVSTLARSRRKVWIVQGKNLARKVVNNCQRCNLDRKQLLIQQMADIKEEQVTVSPPWSNISLDFAGPYVVKGEINKRSRMKVWALIYCCRASKAVCILACPGYSTNDFLCKHAEFVYTHGQPASIVSDRGSQLVAAGKVTSVVDWDHIASKNPGTEWIHVPAGAQHRNGISEAMVKVMKKSLHLALQPGEILTYAEIVTLFAKISYSVNSRPLALQDTSPNSQQDEDMMPLTPNQLLLGRSNIEVPSMSYNEDCKYSARLSYVQQVYNAWWSKWIDTVLPTLVPCKRWKDIRKNVKRGDIVLMKYPGNVEDDYRRARVLEVYPDYKNLVRTVKVGYRKRDKREKPKDYWKKRLTEQIVPVQRLAILQSAGEALPTGGVEDQLPLDATTRVACIKLHLQNDAR